jgi:hypothetical protein
LVVVVVDQVVTVVVNVLHPGTVVVEVIVSATLTVLVNMRTVCCVVVMWSVMYAVCISVVWSVMVARWISVSVVSNFAHGSDEAQEAELVVELLHGSEPHGLELAVVWRLMAFMLRATRALLGKSEVTVGAGRLAQVDFSISKEITWALMPMVKGRRYQRIPLISMMGGRRSVQGQTPEWSNWKHRNNALLEKRRSNVEGTAALCFCPRLE